MHHRAIDTSLTMQTAPASPGLSPEWVIDTMTRGRSARGHGPQSRRHCSQRIVDRRTCSIPTGYALARRAVSVVVLLVERRSGTST